MEKNTNEKSLVIVNNNIFAKMRRFFINIFAKREPVYEEEFEQEEIIEEINNEQPKKRKLFNYDEEVGDDMPESISEDSNTDENAEDNGSVQNLQESENSDDFSSEPVVKSRVAEEKEELERKLMNYYASIKNGI